MKKIIETKLTGEHLKRAGNVSPSDALNEIIWNSLDADANFIHIKILKESEIDPQNITGISVEDDGGGLNYTNIDNALGEYGKSTKTDATKTLSGRPLHGKLGEGRYTYFSIGNSVSWITKFLDGHKVFKSKIIFTKTNRVIVESPAPTQEETGMIVIVDEIADSAAIYFSNDNKVKSNIIKEFAPYLFGYPQIKISLNDENISFSDAIRFKESYKKVSSDSFEIIVINWNELKSGELFILGEGRTTLSSQIMKKIPDNYSVYICSSFFDEIKTKGELDIVELNDKWSEIEMMIDESLSEFQSIHNIDSNKQFIDGLIESGVYPFNEIPDTIEEKTNKKIFDVVAVAINDVSPKINTANKETRKLTYSLIKSAIEEKPASLIKILTEVYKLTPEQQDTFAELLKNISLSSMISAINEIKDRLSFIEEIERIVYSEAGKYVKERTEFQPLLLSQIWLFGEKYRYGADDTNIRNILKEHIKMLGLQDIYITEEDKQNTDFNKIPDILLWKTVCFGEESYDSLVVELKKPTVVIGESELSQIKHYRETIVSDPRFTTGKHKWKFMLIGKDINPYVKKEIETSRNKQFEDEDSIIVVTTWASLLDNARLRYNYFKEKLNLSLESSDVTDSLNKRWDNLFNQKDKFRN